MWIKSINNHFPPTLPKFLKKRRADSRTGGDEVRWSCAPLAAKGPHRAGFPCRCMHSV